MNMYTENSGLKIDLKDYDDVRPYLALRLANSTIHREIVSSCPSGDFLDLSTLACLHLDNGLWKEGEYHTFIIDWDMFNNWGVSREQLLLDAGTNAPFILPPSLQTLEDTLACAGISPDGYSSMEPADCLSSGLYVLTNKRGIYGASAILYPGLLEEIYQHLGAFYVLPCSIHEVIIAPDNEALTPSGLAEIVFHVNRDVLDMDDYLSDSVYYCGENGLCVQHQGVSCDSGVSSA